PCSPRAPRCAAPSSSDRRRTPGASGRKHGPGYPHPDPLPGGEGVGGSAVVDGVLVQPPGEERVREVLARNHRSLARLTRDEQTLVRQIRDEEPVPLAHPAQRLHQHLRVTLHLRRAYRRAVREKAPEGLDELIPVEAAPEVQLQLL